MECKLIWRYLTSDRPVHCRRTLDQYGYPSLRNTHVRDQDQVLYKRTRAHKESHDQWLDAHSSDNQSHQLSRADDSAKVLMVDQLWLWIVDSRKHHLIGSFLVSLLGESSNLYFRVLIRCKELPCLLKC